MIGEKNSKKRREMSLGIIAEKLLIFLIQPSLILYMMMVKNSHFRLMITEQLFSIEKKKYIKFMNMKTLDIKQKSFY